jgi:spore coat polysaccharide biosynthesis protein SpsF (cytidylyltransferase family)
MNSEQPQLTGASMNRRTLLRNGGLGLSLAAIIAACGDDRGGLDEPGRVGFAPPVEPLENGPVNDVVLLRTAQSLEYSALDTYATAAGLGVLSGSATSLVNRFVEDHTRHAEAVSGLIVAAGGQPFACANPWIMERIVAPVVEALDGSDDLVRDVLNTAHALETLAGSTYQLFVGMLSEPELRRAAMSIGADEARHAAALAIAITGSPEGYLCPEVEGEELFPDDSGFPIPYAVPSRFGRVGPTELIVGPRREDGSRFSVTIQTPAENSYVYEFMSCGDS